MGGCFTLCVLCNEVTVTKIRKANHVDIRTAPKTQAVSNVTCTRHVGASTPSPSQHLSLVDWRLWSGTI